MRRFIFVVASLAIIISLTACGSSSKQESQAKAQFTHLEQQNPKLKQRVVFIRKNALGCIEKVHLHIVKDSTRFLECLGFTPTEVPQAKHCLNTTVSHDGLPYSKAKAELEVSGFTGCAVR